MSRRTGSGGVGRAGGTLGFIFVCLLGSSLLRFGAGNFAIAKGVASLASPKKGANPEKSAAVCRVPPDTAALIAAVKERNAQLDSREAKLENRLQALKIAEMKLKQNTAILVKAEKRLTATLAIADQAAEKDIQRLTAVYQDMKAKKAAGLFGAMAPEFAAGFLARMRADSAANILSNLAPNKAYAISLVMAGRNARAPKQ